MKQTIRIIGVSLASMAGILLVSAVASAQALKTPIEGTSVCRLIGEPEKEWVDEDGISHVRGQRGTCNYFGDLRGIFPRGGERFVANWDWDFAEETFFEHGINSFSGRIFGELVEATGHYTLECIGPFQMQTCFLEIVWHVDDGRLVKFTQNWVEGDGDPTFPYTGVILDPPGGAKRNGPRRR
jgi:hypothetical protein